MSREYNDRCSTASSATPPPLRNAAVLIALQSRTSSCILLEHICYETVGYVRKYIWHYINTRPV